MAANTPTGYLSDDDTARLSQMLDTQALKCPSMAGLCGVCQDALKERVLDIRSFLMENLPPDILYTPATFENGRMFNLVRSILETAGIDTLKSRHGRVTRKLAQCLYEGDTEMTNEANLRIDFHMTKNTLDENRPDSSGNSGSGDQHFTVSGSRHNFSRQKGTVAAIFKEDSTFSGSVTSPTPLHRVRQKFMTAMEDHEIPRDQQVGLLHCCLSGLALDYYYRCIQGTATGLANAFAMLQEQFNSFQHQSQARLFLTSLQIDTVMNSKSCSSLEALEHVHNKILDTAPACGPDYQADSHKQDFLANAVKGCEWASNVLQARMTPSTVAERLDYNSFYSKLCAACTAAKEFGIKKEHETSTFYGERYARPKQKWNRHNGGAKRSSSLSLSDMMRPGNRITGGMSKSQLDDIKSRTRCLRCQKKGHWRNECPEKDRRPLRDTLLTMIADNGRDNKAVAKTLWCLIEDEEEYESYICELDSLADKSDDNTPQNDTMENEFEALIASEEIGNDYTKSDALLDLENIFDNPNPNENFMLKSDNENFPAQIFLIKLPSTIENMMHTHWSSGVFEGALLDTGAQRSVIGHSQALAYCKQYRMSTALRKSNRMFAFGKGKAISLGSIIISITVPGRPIKITVDVIKANIPFLVGLDILDRYSLQVLSVFNQLQSVSEGWKVSTVRKLGHIYYTWKPDATVHYNRPQLERLHRHLMHPTTSKLYNLLKKCGNERMTNETKRLIQDISNTCETCQVYKPKQMVFRIRDTECIRFNHRLIMDIMYLHDRKDKSRPVLHIIDAGTKFQSAAFVSSVDCDNIWNTFLRIWSMMYVGFPESVLTDQGSVFLSKKWTYNCELAKIEIVHTGTEAHNSLGCGETYHSILRRVYEKTKSEHRDISCELCLLYTIRALNVTVGPHGLCPQLLVFGILPKLPEITGTEFPDQRERMRAMITARNEYEKVVSRNTVSRGLRMIPSPASDYIYRPGDFVYVYREGLRHYTGPHLVAHCDGKDIRVHMGERTGPRQFNTSQVRPAPVERLKSYEEWIEEMSDGKNPTVMWVEIISKGDEREKQFDEAKRKEIIGLIEKGTFRIVLRNEIDARANIIPSRFVLAIKHSNSGETVMKARFVLGGHRDIEKGSIVHKAFNLKHSSIRLIVALAAILGFDIWSMDVRQAYLQSAEKLHRKVYTKPKELELNPGELLQILKPLYGLTDSGDYWCETATDFHKHDLRMEQANGDFSLFFRRMANKLVSMSGSYVDDLLQASTKEEKKNICMKVAKRFDTKLIDTDKFIYTGILCDSSNFRLRKLSQSEYIRRLTPLKKDASFLQFRSLRAKLMWITSTRPDVACATSFMAQITEREYQKDVINNTNKIVRYLLKTSEREMAFPKLDQHSLRIVVYSDASFNNRPDGRTQLGFVIVLADASQNCSIVSFKSYKSGRVTRSTMAGETLAFVDAFDSAFITKHDLERLLGQTIPLLMLTDSIQLFDVLTKSRYTSEKRLMIDIAAARQAYHEKEIQNVGFIRSEYNAADAMTKIKSNGSLTQIMKFHRIDHPIEQFVISMPKELHNTTSTGTELLDCTKLSTNSTVQNGCSSSASKLPM